MLLRVPPGIKRREVANKMSRDGFYALLPSVEQVSACVGEPDGDGLNRIVSSTSTTVALSQLRSVQFLARGTRVQYEVRCALIHRSARRGRIPHAALADFIAAITEEPR